MLSELGIVDASFCPTLFTDEENNSKRFFTVYNSNVPSLVKAINTKESNEQVLVEEDFLGGVLFYNAKTDSSGFWVDIPLESSGIIVHISEITIDDQNMVTFWRNKKYSFLTPEQVTAEDHVRNALYDRIAPELEYPLCVVTCLPDDTQYSTESLFEGEISVAKNYLERLLDIAHNPTMYTPKQQNCPKCRWVTCPSRLIPEPIKFYNHRGIASKPY